VPAKRRPRLRIADVLREKEERKDIDADTGTDTDTATVKATATDTDTDTEKRDRERAKERERGTEIAREDQLCNKQREGQDSERQMFGESKTRGRRETEIETETKTEKVRERGKETDRETDGELTLLQTERGPGLRMVDDRGRW